MGLLSLSTLIASAASMVVLTSDLQSTSITYKVNGAKKSKSIFCLKGVAGDAKPVTSGMIFTSYASTLKRLKAQRVQGTKLATYAQLVKVGGRACTNLPKPTPTATPTPTPFPSPTPTPSSTPTATPTPTPGNFDSLGNVTVTGKINFGIPANLSGNITAGKAIVQSYCSCHQEKLNRTFPYVRTSIALAPMSFDSTAINDATLANIVAYLNRYNF